jgi:hypothetical protein|tara:strand:- start:1030 stop:1293 length:264 start_codon:yes stop_codon:yes gene_type:complete
MQSNPKKGKPEEERVTKKTTKPTLIKSTRFDLDLFINLHTIDMQNIQKQIEAINIDLYNLDVKMDNNYHMIKGSTSLMRERKEGGSL